MQTTIGNLKDLGFKLLKISNIDTKGRITIPPELRKSKNAKKFYLLTYDDLIVLKGV